MRSGSTRPQAGGPSRRPQGDDAWTRYSTAAALHRLPVPAFAGYERWGTPALRELLRRTAGGALSEGERRLHTILRAAGIGGWTANATVSDLRGRTLAVVDVLFSRERVVVEVDGWVAHGGRDAFERDRRRQNRLVTAGWTMLRFTWSDPRDRPESVAALVRAALLRR